MLQEELRSVSSYLSEAYKNPLIKKYIKLIWFDLLETTNREEIPFLSIFTTQKVKYGKEININQTSTSAVINRLESSILRELENKTPGGGSRINYDMIFGDSQLTQPNLRNHMSKELLNSGNKKEKDLEKNYFFRSKRYFKSKDINERKVSTKKRQRRRSSNIKVFQDDRTIKLFKEIETYLVVINNEQKFWENFIRNVSECLEAIHME